MSRPASGAELLLKGLLQQRIDHVFTVDGPGLSPLAAAFAAAAGDDLEVVRARDEIAAAAMAEAYAFRAKKLCAVITGPAGRALAQMSAVANAWADKVPLLSITLCDDLGPDPNHGVDRRRFDQGAAFHAVTRWRGRADRAADLPALIAEARSQALRGRTGPVHLEVPARLLRETTDAAPDAPAAEPGAAAFAPPRAPADPALVRRAVDLLLACERPLVFCGAGVARSGAQDLLAELLTRLGLPATTSMAGMGAVASDHPGFIGGPSYAAGEAFHVAIRKADVVLALGTAFGGLEGFGLPPLWSGAIKFIHIDLDPLQLGLNVSPELPIRADVKTALEQILEEVKARGLTSKAAWSSWRDKLLKLRTARTARLLAEAYADWPALHQGRLSHELGKKVLEDDLLMVIDGGNTALYAAIYSPRIAPGQFFFPFGMAALGAGLPAAIGFALASPQRRVMLCAGDGSMLYNVQEFETVARLGLPLIVVVNNDSAWNMIRCAQTTMYGGNYVGVDLPNIDYAEIARGFGFHAETITRPDQIGPAYQRAYDHAGPALINAITDKTNYPDSLISFALVEFGGVEMEAKNVLAGLWKARTDGIRRSLNRAAYVYKSFFTR